MATALSLIAAVVGGVLWLTRQFGSCFYLRASGLLCRALLMADCDCLPPAIIEGASARCGRSLFLLCPPLIGVCVLLFTLGGCLAAHRRYRDRQRRRWTATRRVHGRPKAQGHVLERAAPAPWKRPVNVSDVRLFRRIAIPSEQWSTDVPFTINYDHASMHLGAKPDWAPCLNACRGPIDACDFSKSGPAEASATPDGPCCGPISGPRRCIESHPKQHWHRFPRPCRSPFSRPLRSPWSGRLLLRLHLLRQKIQGSGRPSCSVWPP